MKAPTVSVVVPTHNRAHLIGRALKSVLDQSFRDLEVVVMDDASTDDTARAIEALRDARIRHLRSDTRLGPAAQRNRGIQAALGLFVAFQDSDDEWLPGKLERQVRRLQSLPDDVALTHCALLRYEGDAAMRLFNALPPGREASDILSCNMSTFTQTWLARRSALLAVGGFDERLHLWDDWELLLRICQRFRIDGDDEVLCRVYDTPGSQIKQTHHRRQGMDLVLDKHRALLDAHPDANARNHYMAGRFHIMDGHARSGRAHLVRSLRLRPARLQPWLLLVASVFGSTVARSVLYGFDRLRYAAMLRRHAVNQTAAVGS